MCTPLTFNNTHVFLVLHCTATLHDVSFNIVFHFIKFMPQISKPSGMFFTQHHRIHPLWNCHDKKLHVIISYPCGGELRMQKLKSHLVRTQSLNVLLQSLEQVSIQPYILRFLPGISSLFYPSCPFTCIFSKTSPNFSCVTLPDAGSCVECPRNMNRHKKHALWYDDL